MRSRTCPQPSIVIAAGLRDGNYKPKPISLTAPTIVSYSQRASVRLEDRSLTVKAQQRFPFGHSSALRS
jgi:hypothetical protein